MPCPSKMYFLQLYPLGKPLTFRSARLEPTHLALATTRADVSWDFGCQSVLLSFTEPTHVKFVSCTAMCLTFTRCEHQLVLWSWYDVLAGLIRIVDKGRSCCGHSWSGAEFGRTQLDRTLGDHISTVNILSISVDGWLGKEKRNG